MEKFQWVETCGHENADTHRHPEIILRPLAVSGRPKGSSRGRPPAGYNRILTATTTTQAQAPTKVSVRTHGTLKV